MTKQVEIDGDWYDVPDRAKYVAQDEKGDWFWYKVKPKKKSWAWYPSIQPSTSGEDFSYITNTTPPKDFTQELYELVN